VKKIKILTMAVSLLLTPLTYQVQSAQNPGTPPPVSSILVRQGDFALSFLEVLEPDTAYSETQALEMLTELGIVPKNGWISDYPMTPDIIGELQDAVVRTSDYGYLTINPSEALTIFQSLVANYGLSVIPDYTGKQYSETPPSFGYYNYTEPTVINNYYYHSGPPVITYYPPPYGHYHLYSWVPYPFWWGNFWFSGYFVLNDFHRTSRVVILNRHGHKKHFRSHKSVFGVVSNRSKRYHHPKKGFAVYPSKRKFEKDFRSESNTGRRWSKPYKSGIRDNSRFLRHGPEQKGGSGKKAYIRGDNRFNRSNDRFRNDTRHQINNRSSRNPDHVNQRMERRGTGSRTRTGNNPPEIKGPGNNRGSVNAPRQNNPAIRENRQINNRGIRDNRIPNVRENRVHENRRDNPVLYQNRSNTVRENRNPVVHENRRSVDRSRSFEGNRSFQGGDRSF
jgi:hypothetical protein